MSTRGKSPEETRRGGIQDPHPQGNSKRNQPLSVDAPPRRKSPPKAQRETQSTKASTPKDHQGKKLIYLSDQTCNEDELEEGSEEEEVRRQYQHFLSEKAQERAVEDQRKLKGIAEESDETKAGYVDQDPQNGRKFLGREEST
ncbi:hypothetical protein R1sor_015477 [Riccia sorocarpa]|uniref:Uncharacterized protein n=1 Tax=Riccia sorocarpa TaxID=122646 RepID=A0ABD3HCS2_9MARC